MPRLKRKRKKPALESQKGEYGETRLYSNGSFKGRRSILSGAGISVVRLRPERRKASSLPSSQSSFRDRMIKKMSGIQFAYYEFHLINIRESLCFPSFLTREIRGSLHCNDVCRFPFLLLLFGIPPPSSLPFSLSFPMLFKQSLIFCLQLHVDSGTTPAFITRAQSICILSRAFYASV